MLRGYVRYFGDSTCDEMTLTIFVEEAPKSGRWMVLMYISYPHGFCVILYLAEVIRVVCCV